MVSLYYSDIFHYVKAKLDELSNNEDALLVANDQAVEDLDKEIEAAIIPAVRKIHLEAPNILLRDGEDFVKNITVSFEETCRTGYYKCIFDVPTYFLRLVTLKHSNWSRPIQTLLGEDSAEYRKQSNPYLVGTPSRPIGFLLHSKNGSSSSGVVEVYSCTDHDPSSPGFTYGWYIKEPTPLNDQTYGAYVEIIITLKQPCLDKIVADVLRSIGRYQEAALYDQLAVQPFRIDPDWARLNPPTSERFNSGQNP